MINWWGAMDFLRSLMWRVLALLGGGSGPVAGVLGLAAAVYALHYLRAHAGPKPDEAPPFDPNQPSTSAAAAAAARASTAAPTAAAVAVPRRLHGISRLSLSAPGVLLTERSAAALSESATPLPAAVAALQEAARCVEVFLIAHVEDDVGEALVRGALEHAGVVGRGAGQVPPQRLLFCGTLEGKVSVVRQLEPGLHIDAHPKTVSELQRFVAQLVEVQGGGGGGSAAAAGNVRRVGSLAQALGL